MPHLVQMQEAYEDRGLAIVAVTDADVAAAQAFVTDYEVNFRVLSEAATTRERFGVDMIWGSVYFLVDPEGTIVAGSLASAEEQLEEQLGPP